MHTPRSSRLVTTAFLYNKAPLPRTTPSFVHSFRPLHTTPPNQDSNAQQIQIQSEQEMNRLQDAIIRSNTTTQQPQLWTQPQEIRQFVDRNIDHVLFDCDGVLYRSPDAIPGARECIESLIKRGKQVFFVTNNASTNRSELRHKLQHTLQCKQLDDSQMVGCAYACARYLQQQQQLCNPARIYVIGSAGLCDELRNAGFEVLTTSDYEPPTMDRHEMAQYAFPSAIDAVVIGHDTAFSFRKLTIATVLLQQNPNALFVATNRDAYDLVGTNALRIPGNGALVQALEYASCRVAVNVGKPSITLAELIQVEHGLDLSRTMMVGDRLDTDIRFGLDAGMFTALVLTGVTTPDDIVRIQQGCSSEPMPDAVLPYVGLLS